MLDSIMAALRNDGSVLMPVDTAGRVLEVMLLLEKHWSMNRLSYPLTLLSPVAYNTLEFAKSQLEWMNEQVAKEFENSKDKDNPFSMRYASLSLAWCFLHGILHSTHPKAIMLILPVSLTVRVSLQQHVLHVMSFSCLASAC